MSSGSSRNSTVRMYLNVKMSSFYKTRSMHFLTWWKEARCITSLLRRAINIPKLSASTASTRWPWPSKRCTRRTYCTETLSQATCSAVVMVKSKSQTSGTQPFFHSRSPTGTRGWARHIGLPLRSSIGSPTRWKWTSGPTAYSRLNWQQVSRLLVTQTAVTLFSGWSLRIQFESYHHAGPLTLLTSFRTV